MLALEDTHLYIVADGMGGHDCGEVASALAVETMRTSARRRLHEDGVSGEEDLATLLEGAFQDANNTIKEMAEASNNDMGTTLVAAVVRNEIAFVANVGDSRGYLMRGDTLHRVTQDHSLVARMVEHARLTEEQARVHPHSNILLRTVGTERDVEIDIFRLGTAA